jgi:hypothetical protein
VLPWQGSSFANLASEDVVREACAEAGIAWARPRSLILGRVAGGAEAVPARAGHAASAGRHRYAFEGWRGVGV